MILGAVVGALGSLVNQGVQIYRDKQQAIIDKERRSDEYAMAQVNAGKDGLVSSYMHDGKIGEGASQWVINVRAMVRPALTFYSLSIVTIFFFYTDDVQKGFIIASAIEFSSMAGTWWFADRFKK